MWGSVCAGGVISLLGFSSLAHYSYPVGDKELGSFLIPMAEYFPSLGSSSPVIWGEKKKGKQSFGLIFQGKSPDSTV